MNQLQICRSQIIFFEFTFKLKINIKKNLLVNFTVSHQSITEIFKVLSSENSHRHCYLHCITGWVQVKYCQFEVYYWDGSSKHLYNIYNKSRCKCCLCAVYSEILNPSKYNCTTIAYDAYFKVTSHIWHQKCIAF